MTLLFTIQALTPGAFPTINRWENGRAKPSPLAMRRIEELLLSMDDNGKDLLQLHINGEN